MISVFFYKLLRVVLQWLHLVCSSESFRFSSAAVVQFCLICILDCSPWFDWLLGYLASVSLLAFMLPTVSMCIGALYFRELWICGGAPRGARSLSITKGQMGGNNEETLVFLLCVEDGIVTAFSKVGSKAGRWRGFTYLKILVLL